MEKNNNKNYLKLHIFVYDQGEVEKELLPSDDSCKKKNRFTFKFAQKYAGYYNFF